LITKPSNSISCLSNDSLAPCDFTILTTSSGVSHLLLCKISLKIFKPSSSLLTGKSFTAVTQKPWFSKKSKIS
jgi:hypothetical protein